MDIASGLLTVSTCPIIININNIFRLILWISMFVILSQINVVSFTDTEFIVAKSKAQYCD